MKNDRLKRNIPLDTQGPLGGLKKKKNASIIDFPLAREGNRSVFLSPPRICQSGTSRNIFLWKRKKEKLILRVAKEGVGIQLDSTVWKLPLFLLSKHDIYIYIFRVYTTVSSFEFYKRFCIQSLSMELAVRYIWVCAFFGSFFSPFLVYNTKLIRLRNFLCVVISKVEKARLIRCKVI